MLFNSLPLDKILDQSKLKAFADDKLDVCQKRNLVLGKIENIGYQFFPLPTFSKCFFPKVVKSWDYVVNS